MKNKVYDYRNIYITLLCIFIIFLLILFYLFDQKNIKVQKHLNNVHSNSKLLYKKYNTLINKDFKIKKENNIIIIDNFLIPEYYNFLKTQFNGKTFDSSNFLLRKASGYNFFKLHDNNEFTGFLELFYSTEMIQSLSNIVNKPIQRTPLSDANACSLLIYSNKGDHIDWHLDYSTYYGDRYVVLLTVVNENSEKNNLSQNEFMYKHDGSIYKMKMKENSLVIFKGSEIMHKSTAIGENEKRILLSMVFCDICQEKKNIINFLYEKIKNFVVYK
jgi:hypothetical protein